MSRALGRASTVGTRAGGKTVLLEYLVDQAVGCRVLRAVDDKAAGFVSYGSVGGTRAVEQRAWSWRSYSWPPFVHRSLCRCSPVREFLLVPPPVNISGRL